MGEAKRLRLGLMLPIGVGALGDGRPVRWAEIREMAVLGEAIGLDALFAPDHLLFRRSPPTNVPPVDMPEGKTRGIWEVWTILSAVAASTSRVQIGTFVACTGFRNPALLAKMADTLDEVSGGRLVLGLGAGWHEPEYLAFGYPFDHRVSRFEEALGIILPLLREGRVDFRGRYYEAHDAELQPRGPRRNGPSILIGGQGPRMLRLSARHADIYDADFQLQAGELAARLGQLDQACAEVGRDPRAVARSAGARIALAERGEAGARPVGADGVAVYDLGGVGFQARQGGVEEIAAHLRGFQAAGVEHVTLTVVHPPGPRGLERLAAVVAALRRGQTPQS
jgi:alkanesulfonate monooxygenase SsuD/methylene tetrahydromethanopterin reductase-like flavin-dependent oxidoreductase (luciferase family)